MDLDPHTISQILQRIYQQMRCPQCGKKIAVDFSSIRVVSSDCLLLQLRCDSCSAYVVLQAAVNGLENVSAEPYADDLTSNASTSLEISPDEMRQLQSALKKSGGSFEALFGNDDKE